MQKVQLVEGQVSQRDEELNRLNVTFQGGSSFAHIKLGNKLSDMNEIKGLMGVCGSKDPTDMDRLDLETLIKKLKQNNETF